ncbi:MAG TPA: rhomboid family intramembrane serine protease [Rariglobus sp.]|jgi:membrane associated rhomboid family serine protease|nr:rhomboid family intramembrane serine protease [Rariglobus sp.]
MLSDRFYMRDNDGRQTTSVLTWIICAIVAGFILESMALRWFSNPAIGDAFMGSLALSPHTFVHGYVWTLLTYGLLHDPDQFFHIIGNLIALYFLGRELLPFVGAKRFVGICIGSGVLGGLAWLGCNWIHGGQLIGASAAVCGLLVVFACINPNQPITLLLFFFLPVSIKPKYLAFGLLAFDLFGLLFLELPGKSSLQIAHSAHLGGMLAGWIYFTFIHHREWKSPDNVTGIELPRWFRKAQKNSAPTPVYQVNLGSRETLRAEVDRILDKINSEGFAALTPDEKHLLDNAKDQLSRR